MSTIYDIDFQLMADNLNSPTKRKPKITAFLNCLVFPLQWLRDLFFNDYIGGMKYPAFSKITLYNPGDRVTYGDRANYQNIVQSLNISPYNTAYWIKIQDIYLGLDERKHYNAQKIMLERVLNTYFNITPLSSPTIYINNNPITAKSFIVFPAGVPSAIVYPAGTLQPQYVYPAGYTLATQYNYTIYVPIALFTAIDPTPTTAESIIRALVDKYNTSSLTYNIVTY